MPRPRFFLFSILAFVFLGWTSSLSNNSHGLALDQLESAKKAFNRQDYFLAQRLAGLARINSPSSPGPWLLAGHCFYMQGKDQAALTLYSTALRLDPQAGPLPPFFERLRFSSSVSPPASLKPAALYKLRQKIGQMIMVSVPGTELSGQKKKMLNAGWIGGIILFNQNVKTREQVALYVRELQANSPTPLFIAVDQEGGAVRRFREDNGFRTLPSLEALGETENPHLAYRFGRLSGRQLKSVGANLNLAPVVDLDREGNDSIISKYHRSLGPDPWVVSSLAQEIVRGMKDEGVIATAKHFPSETAASANPHDGTAVAEEPLGQLERADLLPYRALIQTHLVDAVMLSHVIYKKIDPYFPASLSSEIIQKLLRKDLGFQGLVISDDLRMDAIKDSYPLDQSVVQAVNAGVDVLLVTDNLEKRVMDSLVRAVETGKVPMRAVDEAYGRIMNIKAKYAILAKKNPGSPMALAVKKKREITLFKSRFPRKPPPNTGASERTGSLAGLSLN